MPDDSKPPANPELPTDVPMTVWEHLADLRKRVVWSLLGVLPCTILAWEFKEHLLDYLVAPLTKAWLKLGFGEPTLHFANPIDLFVAYLQISLVMGGLFASPWVFYQIWSFIAPGLYDKEKAYAIPFALASALFFA